MMRKVAGLLALIVTLGLMPPAQGQQQAASFFTGVNPRDIKFKPIDVNHSNRAFNMSNSLRPPSPPRSTVLSHFFPKITLASWPPKVPQMPILKENPFQKMILPKKK